MKTQNLYTLVGRDLAGYTIVEMTEVFDELHMVALFKDMDIAVAFADTDPKYQVAEVLVLTDGVVGYILPMPVPIELFEDELAVLVMQKEFVAHSVEGIGDSGEIM